jgi:hypothetical protein
MVATSGLSTDAPIVALAEGIVAGTVTDADLVDAWDSWNLITQTRPALAGVAWACMGGTDGLARARRAAQELTLKGRVEAMAAELDTLNRITLARVETATAVTLTRGADRVGRVATRNIRNQTFKAELEQVHPTMVWGRIATAGFLEHVVQYVSPVIEDTTADLCAAVQPILHDAQLAAIGIVRSALCAPESMAMPPDAAAVSDGLQPLAAAVPIFLEEFATNQGPNSLQLASASLDAAGRGEPGAGIGAGDFTAGLMWQVLVEWPDDVSRETSAPSARVAAELQAVSEALIDGGSITMEWPEPGESGRVQIQLPSL